MHVSHARMILIHYIELYHADIHTHGKLCQAYTVNWPSICSCLGLLIGHLCLGNLPQSCSRSTVIETLPGELLAMGKGEEIEFFRTPFRQLIGDRM